MSIVTRTFVLTGGRAGQTCRLGGCYQFTDGKITLRGPGHDVERLATFLGRSYKAFEEGSDELKAAQDGQHSLPAASPERDSQHEVLGGVQPDGDGAPEEAATTSTGADGSAGGDEGIRPTWHGHQNARMARIQEALKQLDTTNKEHWTNVGLPAVAAVRELLGDDTITRADIEKAAPNFTRGT